MKRTARKIISVGALLSLCSGYAQAVTIDPGELLPSGFSLKDEPSSASAQEGILAFKSVANTILLLFAMTCVVLLIFNIVKFAKAADNEIERKKALSAILISGIGIALFGGLGIVIQFFWNAGANMF